MPRPPMPTRLDADPTSQAWLFKVPRELAAQLQRVCGQSLVAPPHRLGHLDMGVVDAAGTGMHSGMQLVFDRAHIDPSEWKLEETDTHQNETHCVVFDDRGAGGGGGGGGGGDQGEHLRLSGTVTAKFRVSPALPVSHQVGAKRPRTTDHAHANTSTSTSANMARTVQKINTNTNTNIQAAGPSGMTMAMDDSMGLANVSMFAERGWYKKRYVGGKMRYSGEGNWHWPWPWHWPWNVNANVTWVIRDRTRLSGCHILYAGAEAHPYKVPGTIPVTRKKT